MGSRVSFVGTCTSNHSIGVGIYGNYLQHPSSSFDFLTLGRGDFQQTGQPQQQHDGTTTHRHAGRLLVHQIKSLPFHVGVVLYLSPPFTNNTRARGGGNRQGGGNK